MESPFAHWSTYANALFWLLLIVLDCWIIRTFTNRNSRDLGSVTDYLRPYLHSKADIFLWIFIYVWFSALVLLETYALFAVWAECFVGCLDMKMKSYGLIGRTWVWFLLISLPAVLLFSVAIALSWACANIVELSLWSQYWDAYPSADEEKAALVVITIEEEED